MNVMRLLRHLLLPPWWLHRGFPAHTRATIETAIRESEKTHGGQIRFAIEATLDFHRAARGLGARARAVELFSRLQVWDTERNNGVLIYLLLADHDVEIVADRGIHRLVGAEAWEQICRAMENHFRAGRFEQGAVEGIHAVGELLARHYPDTGGTPNELPDRPVIL
jgi:hypothetical protein